MRRADLDGFAAGVAQLEGRLLRAPVERLQAEVVVVRFEDELWRRGASFLTFGGGRGSGRERQEGADGCQQREDQATGRRPGHIFERGHGRLIDATGRAVQGWIRKFIRLFRYARRRRATQRAVAVSLRGPRLKPALSRASSC